jgi:hypothetical protein
MLVKLLEVRDRATFLPVMCVVMEPGYSSFEAQRYLLRRCGYSCDGGRRFVMMTPLRADGERCTVHPTDWCGRTRIIAHRYITEHWDELRDGDVVDVEHILGETAEPKKSERETA